LLYTGFYSNLPLLEQYNKPIPKTWDEMIETGKFILNEERKKNNTELTAYNGLFNGTINYNLYISIKILNILI